MTILSRYLTKEIVKYFSFVMIAVLGIYIAVDFIEKVDDFIEASVPLVRMGNYFLLKLPQIAAQVTPVGVLLSVLIVFGLMNRNNELIVLTSSGVSVYTLVRPLLAIGVFFSLFLLLISEVVIPITAPKLNRLWYEEVSDVPLFTLLQHNIWIRGKGSIVHIKHFDPAALAVHNITINQFDKEFNLVRRVDAASGVFKQGKWVFAGVMEQIRDPKQGAYRIVFHEEKVDAFDVLPEDLEEIMKHSEEMSLLELADYVEEVEEEGYDATPYRVDLYAKAALPVACIILSLMAAGIAMRRKTKESISVSIATGLFAVFAYWVLYSFSMSLGYGGMIPPFLAAWIPNFVCLCFSVFILLQVE